MPVPVANFGHEIDLILQHKILAEQGCSFLMVEAASDDWADRIAGWVRKGKPASAQRCGHAMIKYLTESPAGHMPNEVS